MPEVIMPKAGDAMTEGKVVKWYKQPGDAVKKGEPVAEIETDKVNLDLEAEADGKHGARQAKEGDRVPVGNVLVKTLAAGEKEEAPKKSEPKQEEEPQRRATDKKDSVKHTTGEYHEAIEQKGPRRDRSAPESNVVAMPSEAEGRKRSSPLARRMAREMGVSLESVQGSGPRGRIVAADIKNARTDAPEGRAEAHPTLETKIIPLTAMRRTIAKRLAESTGPIPHFYLTVDYDVTNLVSVRQQLIEMTGSKVNVNDILMRAIERAMTHHPNAHQNARSDA